MKRKLILFCCFAFAVAAFTSCSKEDPVVDFDKTDLYGRWLESSRRTLYYDYYSDGTGKTWDSAEVEEGDATSFTWTLTHDNLIQIHIMSVGGNIPKQYTVLILTRTSLVYEDAYGVSASFVKIDN